MNRNVGSIASLTIVAAMPYAFDDRLPKMDARAAQRIDPDLHPGRADRVHVDDVREVADICANVVVAVDAGRFACAIVRDSPHAIELLLEKRVGGALDPRCYVGIGRSAIRRVVLEAAVLGRIMRRGDDDPVGKTALAILVVGQDRVRNDGRRRVSAALVDHRVNLIGGKYLERACEGGLGQRVRVDADEQRSGDAASAPVMTDCLADRQDMRLIEGVVEGGSTMTRCAERNALRRHLRVRFAGEIRRHQPRHIDQHRWLDCFACARASLASHLFLPSKASLTSQIHVRLGTAPDPPGSAEDEPERDGRRRRPRAGSESDLR